MTLALCTHSLASSTVGPTPPLPPAPSRDTQRYTVTWGGAAGMAVRVGTASQRGGRCAELVSHGHRAQGIGIFWCRKVPFVCGTSGREVWR